jgi:sugar phosphate isomerase/epimerase
MAELCFNTFNRSAWFGVDPDLPAQIAAAGAAGFPWFGPDRFSLDHWTASGRPLDELAGMIAEAGMVCWEISALNVTDRAETVAEAEHLAAQAAVLGPRWILTNLGAPLDDAACDAFDAACRILAEAGCRPAVEYLDLVAYVQFDDARPMVSDDLVEETIHRRTFPGEGEFELDRYCDTMRRKGFDGVVSVEILDADERARADDAAFARRVYETSARFWPPSAR